MPLSSWVRFATQLRLKEVVKHWSSQTHVCMTGITCRSLMCCAGKCRYSSDCKYKVNSSCWLWSNCNERIRSIQTSAQQEKDYPDSWTGWTSPHESPEVNGPKRLPTGGYLLTIRGLLLCLLHGWVLITLFGLYFANGGSLRPNKKPPAAGWPRASETFCTLQWPDWYLFLMVEE